MDRTLNDYVTLADVRAARERIAAEITRTPLILSDAASRRAGGPVYFKLENLQRTGSFKVRGALNRAMSLAPPERQRGIVCASSGNHGLGVAYAGSRLGVPRVVVLPQKANPYKVKLLEELGAEVVRDGETSDLCHQTASAIARDKGYTLLHPFADPAVIAGQGTVGLEVLDDLPEVDEVYVPIGGGGLISGIAVATKEQRPRTRIWGVQPENSNSMWAALRQGHPVSVSDIRTVADGLSATTTREINLAHVRRYAEDVILVSDQAILDATLFVLQHAKVLVEPSAAASFAGLLANARRQGPVVAVMSGGNVSLQQLDELRRVP